MHYSSQGRAEGLQRAETSWALLLRGLSEGCRLLVCGHQNGLMSLPPVSQSPVRASSLTVLMPLCQSEWSVGRCFSQENLSTFRPGMGLLTGLHWALRV